jgi:hypothetical protein
MKALGLLNGLLIALAIMNTHSIAFAASDNGRAGVMPAFYDDELFTINFKEQPAQAEESLLAHNRSINVIYMSDTPLPGNVPFVSVLDAIQGDGFNPLWLEVQIIFKPGVTPFQLTSDTDVEEAFDDGLISLAATDEVYRCSVIGPQK